jgi:hypothetical protein
MQQDTRLVLFPCWKLKKGADNCVTKVLQRVYKYGGQPFVRDYLAKNYGTDFDATFGAKTGKAMMHSLAGRYVGETFSGLRPHVD